MENPSMKLTLGGEPFVATPENTSIFTFIGELALYNHIFLQKRQETAQNIGSYLFERFIPEMFAEMRDYMFQNGYPMHVNLQEVAECDRDAFEKNVQAVVDTIPDTIEGLDGTPE